MSDTKHTPGPWRAEGRWVVGPDGEPIVETAAHCRVRSGEAEANARLIAAAPELIQRLENLIALVEMDDEARTPGTDLYTEVYLSNEALREVRGT